MHSGFVVTIVNLARESEHEVPTRFSPLSLGNVWGSAPYRLGLISARPTTVESVKNEGAIEEATSRIVWEFEVACEKCGERKWWPAAKAREFKALATCCGDEESGTSGMYGNNTRRKAEERRINMTVSIAPHTLTMIDGISTVRGWSRGRVLEEVCGKELAKAYEATKGGNDE